LWPNRFFEAALWEKRFRINGRGDRIWTCDSYVPKELIAVRCAVVAARQFRLQGATLRLELLCNRSAFGYALLALWKRRSDPESCAKPDLSFEVDGRLRLHRFSLTATPSEGWRNRLQ